MYEYIGVMMNRRKTSGELKALAREHLLGNYRNLSGYVTLILLISMFVNSMLVSLNFSSIWTELIVSMVEALIMDIFTVGFIRVCMKTVRSEKLELSDFFYVVKHDPDKIIIIAFVKWIFTVLFQLPLLMGENIRQIFQIESGMFTLIKCILTAVFLIAFVFASILLSQCYYLYIDRADCDASEIIRMSIEVMNHNKARFFYLCMSMVGMVLLIIITFGIGVFWVMPYMYTTLICFYEELKGDFDGYNIKA